MDNDMRLKHYKNSLQSAWGYNDYNDWPVKVNSVIHIFLADFATEFLKDLEDLKHRNVTTSEIAKAFGNPARFYRLIDPVIFGMKRLKMDIHRQREIVLYLLDIVKKMKFGSEFNENGGNYILSPEKLKGIQESVPFIEANLQIAAMLQRFCGLMWAYTEAIFFRAHEVTKEIHGPYTIGETEEKVLIREYLHLKPFEIWGEIPFIPYKKISIFSKYSKDLMVSIDSYNHLFLHGGNYVEDLVSYWIEVDGKQIDIDKLMKLVPVMQNTIQTIHTWVDNSDWHDRVNRYADIFWYRKSPLRTLQGKDWRVPEPIREKIRSGSPDPKRLNNLSDEAIDRLIQIVI